ncbi:uncharacterized protein LOC143152590, partial [Ptiloglossa arizonensis]|uniref:uncharacterized protein LOC143152590 n=1 Tax=Ptiloglossa arizonensis TaxID=3350558 RepID=UPI003FA01280
NNVNSIHRIKLVSQQHNKRLSILRSDQDVYCLKNSISHRKLLSYTENTIHKNSSRDEQFRETNTQLRKRGSLTKKTEKTDPDEQWDEWADWTTCSVTCGSGRQVRWRHCLAENCMKGLKKAQIKPCRLQSCNSTNILRWLGIKS